MIEAQPIFILAMFTASAAAALAYWRIKSVESSMQKVRVRVRRR